MKSLEIPRVAAQATTPCAARIAGPMTAKATISERTLSLRACAARKM